MLWSFVSETECFKCRTFARSHAGGRLLEQDYSTEASAPKPIGCAGIAMWGVMVGALLGMLCITFEMVFAKKESAERLRGWLKEAASRL